MKYLFVSDIHGSLTALQKILHIFDTQQCDMLCLGGDLLNYGPRNGLPEGLDPMAIAEELNKRADRIIAVRGNCDTEVDQMVLEFPVLADYCILYEEGHMIFATHGHVHNEKNVPPLKKGDILLHGHTHVPKCTEHETYTYINPGSVSIPKEESAHSYLILEDGTFTWKNLEGESYQTFSLK